MSIAANLDINVRANTDGIQKGMQRASNNLGQFKKAVDTHSSAIGERMRGMSERITGALEKVSPAGAKLVGAVLAPVVSLAGKLGPAFAGSTAGIDAATTAMSAFGTATTIATGGLNILLAGLAGLGAASVGGGLLAMKGFTDIDKKAKDIGVSTEALAGLQHAADHAEVDVGALDETLTTMQVRLRGAATQTGEVSLALSQLGIKAEDIQNATPDEAFIRIADALSGVGNESERARLAVATLGEQGTRLLPMFAGGAGAIRAAMRDAKELGIAVTNGEAQQVQQAEIAMADLKKSFTGIFRTMAIVIAPFVTMIADAMTRGMKWIISFRDSLIRFGLTAKFVWDHFGEYASLAFDAVVYKAIKLANQLEHIFLEVLPAAIKGMWDTIVGTLTGEGFQNSLDKALDEIKRSMKNRAEGDIEAELRRTYERNAAALEKKRQAFLKEKMEVLAPGGTPTKKGLNPKLVEGPTERRDNAVVERGSQEAFRLMARTSGDKMLKAANDQLAEIRKTNKFLDKILRKPNGGLARGVI